MDTVLWIMVAIVIICIAVSTILGTLWITTYVAGDLVRRIRNLIPHEEFIILEEVFHNYGFCGITDEIWLVEINLKTGQRRKIARLDDKKRGES